MGTDLLCQNHSGLKVLDLALLSTKRKSTPRTPFNAASAKGS